MSNTRIYFVRHGETDWNVQKRFQGQVDTDLNDNGRQQAHAIAQRLAGLDEDFRALYSSPQKRAIQTAASIAATLGLAAQTDDNLKEINCGAWEGLDSDGIEEAFPGQLAVWRANVDTYRMPGGESVRDVQVRGAMFYQRVLQEHRGEALIVVGHGASILAMVAHTQSWDLTTAWNDPTKRIHNTGVIVVNINGNVAPVITGYNW